MQNSGEDIIAKGRLKQYTEIAMYRDHIVAMRGICAFCRVRNEAWDYKFSRCAQRHQVFQLRAEARRRLEARGRTWLRQFSACFWCLNPQAMCSRVGSEDDRNKSQCNFPNVVLPLCYGVYSSPDGPTWVKEHFERTFNTVDEYIEWLGEETEFGGVKAVQAVRVTAEALRFLH